MSAAGEPIKFHHHWTTCGGDHELNQQHVKINECVFLCTIHECRWLYSKLTLVFVTKQRRNTHVCNKITFRQRKEYEKVCWRQNQHKSIDRNDTLDLGINVRNKSHLLSIRRLTFTHILHCTFSMHSKCICAQTLVTSLLYCALLSWFLLLPPPLMSCTISWCIHSFWVLYDTKLVDEK